MVTNLSTSQYLITGATTSGAASESTSSASTGMRPAAAGSQPDILFLTRANGTVSGFSSGGRIVDMPASLQNKTAAELIAMAGSPSAAGYSSLPQVLKDNNSSYASAPFAKAGEGQTAQFTLFTNRAGDVVGVDKPGEGGMVSLNPPLNMAEFSRMVGAEGSDLSELRGLTFRTMETMVAASSTGGLVYSTLDGSFMSAPPAPRPMAANPYLAPSTAAQLTSILMEVASLKAKVADKESEAILNTMQFMLEDARNRIAINHDKADAEKLAAAAKIVAATMSIVGGLVSLGGAMAAERSYQAEKKKPGDAAEVSDVSDGSAAADASRKGAESTSKQRAARDADLDARRADHADADAARVRTESGRGVMGGEATARANDRGELTVTVGDGPSSRTGTLSATPDRPAVEPDGASKTKPIDGAGEAKETKGEAWDKDEALNRRTERKEFAEFLGDKVIGKTGEIVAQGMTIASIDQRSEAERNEIVSQTYGELTRMVQQQIVGDQQNVNNEFKEILALAKELMQKETDQLAQLFQMRM